MHSMDPTAHWHSEYQQYPTPLADFRQYPVSPGGIRLDFSANSPTWPYFGEYHKSVATIAKMNQRVSIKGFHIPSPSCMLTFDNISDMKLPPVSPTATLRPPHTARSDTKAPSGLSSCQMKGENNTSRPFTPRSSCMMQAAVIGEMLLDDRQFFQTCYSPPRSNSIASSLLLEESISGYTAIPDLSPTMSIGLSGRLSDAIDYIHVTPQTCQSELFGHREISISDHKNILPSRVDRKSVSKMNHGKRCCAVCKKTFKSQANLRLHARVHTGEKPYECQICHKRFTQSSSLSTHLRIHTGERPYSCPVCSRTFTDYSTWRKHCRLHSGERPYVCKICGKGFAQSGNLIHHRLTHQKSEPALKVTRDRV